MRSDPTVLHGRCCSNKEQSREHLERNTCCFIMSLSRYIIPELALFVPVVYSAIKSVPHTT